VYDALTDVSAAVIACEADSVIVLPCPEWQDETLQALAGLAQGGGVEMLVGEAMDVPGPGRVLLPEEDLPLRRLERFRLPPAAWLIKPVLDRFVAAALLVLTAPLLILVAAGVGLGSRGAVFDRRPRVGRNGRPFRRIRFRVMYRDAEQRLADVRTSAPESLLRSGADPRMTRLGRWLHRWSLDALPELFNVLAGHLSLVGPQPARLPEVLKTSVQSCMRLSMRPGMTGLWKLSGGDRPWAESAESDLRYLENWSLTLDLVLLLRTVSTATRQIWSRR
jgi:lipopolysaccharide/colanic/teichoic acid biosynthesis glycosyltransferase